MKIKGHYSGIIDIEKDGKVQAKEFTLYDGDTIPEELEDYLAANFPDLISKIEPNEKSAESPKNKMIGKSPKDK